MKMYSCMTKSGKLENASHPSSLLSRILSWDCKQKLMRNKSSVLKIVHIFEVKTNAQISVWETTCKSSLLSTKYLNVPQAIEWTIHVQC